ncbi:MULTISPECIES: histidine phosphatase family protein [unclassified Lentimonas]|uniref:histidine phosphatase family protein n=1 Tax=unclassified Lentimonas TaxID=2630993 RepID=UPI00138A0EA2|nr:MULTISPECIES: histidine phosphatase family protein [unclassified Lentimonas]
MNKSLHHRRASWITLISLLLGASFCEAGLKIYYIRHAEGGHNVKRDWVASGIPEAEWPGYVGDPNQFTPEGRLQQATVSAELQALQDSFDFIASSPAWRSYNTIWPYIKDVNAGPVEIWPELEELSVRAKFFFTHDLPEITEPVLGQGRELTLTEEEAEWFTIRPGGEYGFKIPRAYEDDSLGESAAGYIVFKAAVDMILDRFGGTDQAILLAGHGASGKNLARLLTNEFDQDSIENAGIWMAEQQSDGSFKMLIYNSVALAGARGEDGTTTVRFDDLRADLSDGKINGRKKRDSDVTITVAMDEDDIVYSLSIANQDFDGVGGSDDSLSWDIRVEGFKGGSITEDGNDSSVKLGASSRVHMSDDYFGVSNERYVDEGDSIRFSVENVVLDAADGTSVQFDGFDGIYGSDDSYVFGVGSGLQCMVTDDDAVFNFTPTATLTLSCPTNKFRVRDLTGSFTVNSAPSN